MGWLWPHRNLLQPKHSTDGFHMEMEHSNDIHDLAESVKAQGG